MSRDYYAGIGAAMSMVDPDVAAEILGAGLDALADRIPDTHGKYVYVSSVNGSNNYDGLSMVVDSDNNYGPVATIDYAVGLCDANSGDVIIVLPGHTETFTGTNCTVDVAGVTVWGVGQGSLMPQIKHNHANAEVSISADNVRWHGIRHSADVTTVGVAIEIEDGADYCEVDGCRFDVVTTGTDEFNVCVRTNDASNNAHIHHNFFNMGIAAAVAAISFTKDTDETEVDNNIIMGDYSTACINGITTLSTNLLIHDNKLMNGLTGAVGTEPGIELLTGSTGWIYDNYIGCDLATKAAAIVADTCMLFENYYCETVGETGGIIGTASTDDG